MNPKINPADTIILITVRFSGSTTPKWPGSIRGRVARNADAFRVSVGYYGGATQKRHSDKRDNYITSAQARHRQLFSLSRPHYRPDHAAWP